jgi:hypothetical protein
LIVWKAFLSLVLVLLSWQLFNCQRAMEMPMRGGGRISRRGYPKLFWSLVALQCWVIGSFSPFLCSFQNRLLRFSN